MKERFFTGLEKIKQGQTLLLVGFIFLLSVLSVGLVLVLFSKRGSEERSLPSQSYKSSITNASSRVNPKELWVERFTSEQDQSLKRMEVLEKKMDALTQSLQSSQEKAIKVAEEKEEKTPRSPSPEGSDSLQEGTLMEGLREDMKKSMKDTQGISGVNLSSQGIPGFSPQKDVVSSSFITSHRPHTKGIQRVSLSLVHSRAQKSLKTGDNTIPAGAFAQAVLLGGVDASTSIQAASDPRPILLRLTNTGTLPRRFRSDLYGCHVLAATYGDLSSERVYMRLEKLTCTEWKTGEIIEMNVAGYVAGEDGRAGLRGTVVDRAGESVRNAAIGGFLGGVGSFLSQPNNPITYSLTSGLAQTQAPHGRELLGHGLAKGAGNALEKYADFYIKRAEQMQPVLQVQSGRMVDIVFTQGVALEDSAARSALIKKNDHTRFATMDASSPEGPPVPAESWIPPTSTLSSEGVSP